MRKIIRAIGPTVTILAAIGVILTILAVWVALGTHSGGEVFGDF